MQSQEDRSERPEHQDRRAAGTSGQSLRLCAVTRQERAVTCLLRFVAAPDGAIIPDLKGKLPGRGVWVGAHRRLVETAVARNVFARSLKRPVRPDAGLADLVARLIRTRSLERLAIANKAGEVVAGFVKVEKAIAAGGVAALIHAREAAADGTGKLDRAFRHFEAAAARETPRETPEDGAETSSATCAGGQSETILAGIFASEELSLALGRANVIHAALRNGGASGQFLQEVARLRIYENAPTWPRG
ncbi:MAG: RNA-binding protein [Hyphomicrobiaceae bacterium]